MLFPVLEVVGIAILILTDIFIYFSLIDDSTPFSSFWYWVENPFPEQQPASFPWVGLAITVLVAIIAITLGFFVLLHIQGPLASFEGCKDPKNMSTICQEWGSLIQKGAIP